MYKREFIDLINRHNITILSDEVKDQEGWINYIGLKESTEVIDFGCNFDSKGNCNTTEEEWSGEAMCCCANCKNSLGYLRGLCEDDIKFYASKFHKKTGFWRKKKGCILSRAMRSETCVVYSCDDDVYKRNREISFAIRDLERMFVDDYSIR